MRELTHTDSGLRMLPAPMPPAVSMSRQELWQATEVLSRLMVESVRRGLPDETFVRFDEARAVVLGMYTLTPDGPR